MPYICFFIFILSACHREKKQDSSTQVMNTFIVDKKDEIDIKKYSQLNIQQKCIELFLPEKILIGNIDEVLINDKYIFILDSKISNKVFQFEINGKFVRTIGEQGKGPGEYSRADDISIDSILGSLLIFSARDRKLLKFSINTGSLKQEQKLDFAASEIQPISDKIYAVFNHDIFNLPTEKVEGNLNYNLLFTNHLFNKVISKHFISNTHEGEGKSIYKTGRYFNTNLNATYLCWRFNDTTYKIENGKILPFVYLDFGNKKVVYKNYEESTSNYILPKILDGTFYSLVKPTLIANNILLTKFIMADEKKKTPEDQCCYLLASVESDSLILIKKFEDDIYNGVFNFPIGTYQDSFISILYPEEYIDAKNPGKNELYFSGTNSIIKRYGNPILCLTKFKNF